MGTEGGGTPLGFHGEAPFSIFRIPVFCAKSQKEINLTLKRRGLHLFVKDVRRCLNDDANSSKPTSSWHSTCPQPVFAVLGTYSSDLGVNPDHVFDQREDLKLFCELEGLLRWQRTELFVCFDMYKRPEVCFNNLIDCWDEIDLNSCLHYFIFFTDLQNIWWTKRIKKNTKTKVCMCTHFKNWPDFWEC